MLSWNGRSLCGKILYLEISAGLPKPAHSERVQMCSPENLISAISESVSTPSEFLQQVHSPKEQIQQNVVDFNFQDPFLDEIWMSPDVKVHEEEQETLEFNGKVIRNICVQTSPLRDFDEIIEKSPVKVKPKSNRGRKKKDAVYVHPVQNIGENLLQAYGSVFIVKKVNKKNDDNTVVRCEICERDFRKKSIRSHTVSRLHGSKLL